MLRELAFASVTIRSPAPHIRHARARRGHTPPQPVQGDGNKASGTTRAIPAAIASAIRGCPSGEAIKRASPAPVSTAISTVATGTREKMEPVSAPCREPIAVRESPKPLLRPRAGRF